MNAKRVCLWLLAALIATTVFAPLAVALAVHE